MSKILEMIEKRNKAWEGAKAFLDSKRDKDGLISEEDALSYDEMEKKVHNYSLEIERLQKIEEMDKELSKPLSDAIVTKPMKVDDNPEKKGRASDEYRRDMLKAIRSNFKQVTNLLQEGVDTDGGYLVPEEYDKRLIDVLTENNIMRTLGTKITTSGLHRITVTATKPAALWVEEGGKIPFDDATFGQITIDAFKLAVGVKITNELLYDSMFPLENYIIEQFGKAIGNAEEDAFLNGDGKKKPLGIFHKDGGAISDVTTAGATISSDDIISLVYALGRPYRQKAKFIMNDQTIAIIRKLKDGNGNYMWQPSIKEGEPDRLLGYPIFTSAYAPLVEAGKPAIAFGDFSYYNIADRGTRSMQELTELYAETDTTGFIAKERVDGKLILPEAVHLLTIKAK
ncbi:TPA: phage major capsid protein [Streptococcus agalactiae]|uniref:phage major capsid protein n=1 Tax=Bacillota TaxID=1239 RepID=UPI0008A20231|nr:MULTISPECIES: phage major capsid protein [Bacillota]OFJ72485.1 capsid protein [Anaerococcus sp. HMSC065G05]